MTADSDPADTEAAQDVARKEAKARAARAARHRKVFGDPLPDVTSDERGEPGEGGRDEEWYRSQRPPHHGG